MAFTDATSAAIGAERSVTVQPGNLPAGLPVVVELARDVPLDQAAAGDRIEGRLASPIQAPGNDPHAKPFAAAGALVSGRLMRVETRYSSPPDVTVVLRWETVDLNGVKTPLSLDPVRNSGGSGVNVKSSTLDRLKGLRTRGVEIELPKPGEARYSPVHIHGDHPVLKAGVRSSWVTSKP